MTYEEVKAVMETERSRMGEALKIGAQLEKMRSRLYYAQSSEKTLRQYDSKSLQSIGNEIVDLEEKQEKLLAPSRDFLKLINLLDDNIDWAILFHFYSNRKTLAQISTETMQLLDISKQDIYRKKRRAMKKIADKSKNMPTNDYK
ncbi:hypothetical protein [Culicoidibacter larvae]|uniref:DUF1492 domain-containing protein n=1 Tax=Culicoidibacter larvae TaxID=2579976 RepID=A0A5R8Q8A2_9FIRM|nr:hypothetical protein [Culicoidibacter larvae]TLG71386.1 hypothetical protein FEZ08_10855 [Culicoidibacter larvae]